MKKLPLVGLLLMALGLVAWTSAGDVKIVGSLLAKVERFYGATGTNFVKVPDNVASALVVEDYENGGDLLTLTTTDSSEQLTIASRYLGITSVSGALTASAFSAQGTVAASGLVSTTVTQATTVGTGGDSFTLPPAAPGLVQMVCNGAAANAMDVFPYTSDSINKESANTAISLAAGECMFCIGITTVIWGCVIGSAT